MAILISCEAGGNRVPSQWVADAPNAGGVDAERESAKTDSFDPGKLPGTLSFDAPARYASRRMAEQLRAPLVANAFSLELIDVTRSLHHRQLFPEPVRRWSAQQREELINQIHRPYRHQIRSQIEQLFSRHTYVIHLSVRSFPLRSKGKHRRADVGLLYDPSRDDEVDFCLDWIDEMYEAMDMVRVRRNYPRRGTSDSITKAMRQEFADRDYLGVEVLLNQAWVGRKLPVREWVIDGMCGCLRSLTSAIQGHAA